LLALDILSLSLHDRTNKRIMGFDNAHAIEYGRKRNVAAKRTYDHWHSHELDQGKPYIYKNAAKLLENFWKEVDKKINVLNGVESEKQT